jgi:excisionase family DNA binding protein
MSEIPVFDLKALSKKLNIGIPTLRKYIKSGELKAKKVGKKYFVTEFNLMAFLGPDS